MPIPKTERFELRFSPREKTMIAKAAKKADLPMAAFIRKAVLAQIEMVTP